MMPPIIRFIGDVHGKYGRYKTILADSPYPTIQVGDMGVGFRRWPHGEPSANPPFDQMKAGDHRFIRGNHDNPDVCRRHPQCIADGTVQDDVMFVGGALSIDASMRYEDFSWWRDEELSYPELMAIIELFAVARPRIMVTHECPELIAEMIIGRIPDLRGGRIKMDPRFASRTRVAFQNMFEMHQPEIWIFGHYHVWFDENINGTRFVCIPELGTIDVQVAKRT